jgi:hypothetical protein
MKPTVWMILAISIPALAGAEEIVVEGIVYNRTKILESVADTPPEPADVGEAGVQVMLLGLEGLDRSMGHPMRPTDDTGRVKFVLDLPGENLKKPISAIATYEGVRFDFVIPPGGKFEAPVYETTADADAVKILKDEVFLDVSGDPPDHVRVLERIVMVNTGARAFQGNKPKAAMPHGILISVGVPAPPHDRPRAVMGKRGAPLEVRMRDDRVMAVVGTLPPTGPEGETILIAYSLHVGEEGGGPLSRPLYTDTDSFQVYYAKKGIKVRVPDGFSDPIEPDEAELKDFFLVEKGGIPGGTEVVLGLSLRSARFYWVLAGFAGAFVLALILALVGAVGGPGAVRSSAFSPEIDRIIEDIDALDPAAEGRRVAHLERILEILRQGRKPPDAG